MDPTGGVFNYLFTQGVLGIVVVILLFVCNKLYNKADRLQTEKDVLTKEIIDLTDARRIDDKATTTQVLNALSESSQTYRLVAEKIESAKRLSGGQ